MKLKIQLPPLHPGQLEIREALQKYRFVIALTGRRFGKTTGALIIVLERCLTYPEYTAWWLAPTYNIARLSFRLFKRICPPDVIKYKSDSEMFVEFLNSSTLAWKSADRPESLLGEGLNFLVFDEAAEAKPEAWEYVAPALSDKRGQALFLSRPHGVWLRELGEQLTRTGEGIVIHKRSIDNPFFPPEEWERAKQRLPPWVFKVEYEAEWVQGASAVFPYAWETLNKTRPRVVSRVVLGVDPGRTRDFFAVAAVNACRQILWLEHRKGLPFELQLQRISALQREFDADIWIDSHALGLAFYELFMSSGLAHRTHAYPVKDRATRNDLVETLAMALDPTLSQEPLSLPTDFPAICQPSLEELRRELEAMRYEITPSGEVRYLCEKGVHDDLIIALALALKGVLSTRQGVLVVPRVTGRLLGTVSQRRSVQRKYSTIVRRKYAVY